MSVIGGRGWGADSPGRWLAHSGIRSGRPLALHPYVFVVATLHHSQG
jgi:hypothetical protein